MRFRPALPHLAVIAMMAVGVLALEFGTGARMVDETGVHLSLPSAAGEWTASAILYCQNAACMKVSVGEGLAGCPECGAALDKWAPGEQRALPADTVLLRKQYHNAAGETLRVSVVISGRERISIHRPQVCLTGQGYDIVNTSRFAASVDREEPLEVAMLELLRRQQTADGRLRNVPTFYAYWFVGSGIETPSHLKRMYYMARDRVVFGRSHRWAYVAVHGMRRPESNAHVALAQAFLRDFHPLILSE